MWYHFSLRNENNEPQSFRFLLIKTPRGIGGTVMAAQDKRTDFFLWVYKVWLQEDSTLGSGRAMEQIHAPLTCVYSTV